MEHYLEIVSVSKTLQICQCWGGKAALQVPKAAPSQPQHIQAQLSFSREGCSQLTLCSLNMQQAPLLEGGRTPIHQLMKPCVGAQHLPSGFHPTQQQRLTVAIEGQMKSIEKSQRQKISFLWHRSQKEAFPQPWTDSGISPFQCLLFCPVFPLHYWVFFFLQNWEAVERRPSWLNLFESKEYTNCPIASDFFSQKPFILISFPTAKQLAESTAEAGGWCQLETIILWSLPSHVLPKTLPILNTSILKTCSIISSRALQSSCSH